MIILEVQIALCRFTFGIRLFSPEFVVISAITAA